MTPTDIPAYMTAVGAAARADVEAFTGRPLFLELSVKVAPKWRSDERAVRQFGY